MEAEEEDNEDEVELDGALLPITCVEPDFERADWGKREDGRPAKSDEDVVAGVAVEGCVGDEDATPADFLLPSALLLCILLSWPKTAPPSLRTCRQISSVICIWWICLCCKTLSSSKRTARVGGTCTCPCSTGELEACCRLGLELSRGGSADDEDDEDEEEVVVVAELPTGGEVMVV